MSDDRTINTNLNIRAGEDTARVIKDLQTIDDTIKDIGKSATSAGGDLSGLRVSGGAGRGGGIAAASADLETRTGKAESSIRGLSGAVGALGGEAGQTVATVGMMAAELPAAATGLFDMATATGGLTLSMAPMIAGMVAAAAAVAALAFLINELKTEGEEAAEVRQAEFDAQHALNEAYGMTTEAIYAALDAKAEERRVAQADADFARQQADEIESGERSDILFGIGDALGIVGQEGDQANDRLIATGKTLTDLDGQIAAFEQALGSSEVAENDAAAAAEALAKETKDVVAAEKKQVDITKELAKASQDAAKAQADAAAATREAQAQQRRGMEEFIISAITTTEELGTLQAEQSKKMIDLANENTEEENKIQRDLAKKKKAFANDQQFLALFDLQSNESEEKKERDRARSKEFQELREALEMERAEKQMAFQAGQEDKMAQLQQDAILTGEAVANEQKILREASNNNLKILSTRAKQETEIYQQLNSNVVQMLNNVTQFAGQAAGQVNSLLAQGGAGGGRNRAGSVAGGLANSVNRQALALLQEVTL